jgi:hypothetical protein
MRTDLRGDMVAPDAVQVEKPAIASMVIANGTTAVRI